MPNQILQTMPATYSGQCLCGAVKFAVTSEPITVLSCFCDHCSKGAGGVQQLIGKFSIGEVQISTTPDDAISRYVLTDTSSGNCKEKAFCRVCGCTLWTVPAAAQGKLLLIRLPLLGQGLDFKPRIEIFTRNRPTWVEPVKDAEQWEEGRK